MPLIPIIVTFKKSTTVSNMITKIHDIVYNDKITIILWNEKKDVCMHYKNNISFSRLSECFQLHLAMLLNIISRFLYFFKNRSFQLKRLQTNNIDYNFCTIQAVAALTVPSLIAYQILSGYKANCH